ncbi:winged helix-turn-helix domain-containing protein [Arsenicicoccus piscis]|uniref:ArsR/SmtB family transcription factor n=1 Tax=Arsenicicoccus piscis TaxID=673954 RepID=UPI001F4C7B8C|nr:winged helix-turn-helix domain-containing protein [Arsenicicoccus piscis]MCH8627831.1 winged helix-turn-helix domain-containing protein [Arsenicicoccus piscis]
MSTDERLAARAHPLRSRLLRELATGPATATDLAGRLGTNSGATSYHLRRLAAVGLVVDTEAGTGRRREWALAPDPVDPPAGSEPADAEALDWLERDYLAYLSDKATAYLDTADEWPARWREAAGQRDYLIQVTDAQLRSFNAELAELAARYRNVGQGNPAAKRVSVYQVNLPLDPPPRRAARSSRPGRP